MRLPALAPTALALLLAAHPAAAQNAPPRPCHDGDHYADFDFWLGDWNVTVPDGRQAGTNHIEKTQEGCLVEEHWTGVGGGTGMSVNFYDAGRGQWRQIWVSTDGTVIEIEGGLRDGAMVLEGALTNPDGTTQPYRGTWTPNPDGSVRQFLEISEDGGKTWGTWFDGKYVHS